MNEDRNLFIVLILSTFVMVSWQYFYETPRLKKLQLTALKKKVELDRPQQKRENFEPVEEILKSAKKIEISNGKLIGSIDLKGAKIDDISLVKYEKSIGSEEKVRLLSPSRSKESYFVEFGWLKSDKNIGSVPDKNTIWQSDQNLLTQDNSVKLFWRNSRNILFEIIFEIDNEYLLKITQLVENHSKDEFLLQPYGRINRSYYDEDKSSAILHEGSVSVLNDKLYELKYKKLKSNKKEKIKSDKSGSWLGITDKYWLTAIIPNNNQFEANFNYFENEYGPRYQVDFIGETIDIKSGDKNSSFSYVFLGPKKLSLLEDYGKKYQIKLLDRAVDFGWFYFLTKPMFYCLQILYEISTNFGVAIILLTVLVKLLMFPLANKSSKSMIKMKTIQPKINKLKEIYGDDKLKFNQEVMSLYRKEKINPVLGCLPIIIQAPVFFSLYKVLFVTIEMRHARFFGWIKDLSIPDPTSILNLFGLAPWAAPEFLSIGIWPIIMGITMYFQQKANPEPSDPVQAKLVKFLPLIFTFMFYKFPAGLIIYWAWNNILSILQQYFLLKRTKLNEKKK